MHLLDIDGVVVLSFNQFVFPRAMIDYALTHPAAIEFLFTLKYTQIPDERYAGMIWWMWQRESERVERERVKRSQRAASSAPTLPYYLTTCPSPTLQPSLWSVYSASYRFSDPRRLTIDAMEHMHRIVKEETPLQLMARKRYDVETGVMVQREIWPIREQHTKKQLESTKETRKQKDELWTNTELEETWAKNVQAHEEQEWDKEKKEKVSERHPVFLSCLVHFRC